MNAIIDRLDTIIGQTGILVSDVRTFESQLSRGTPVGIDSSEAGVHRAYVKAVFALIEALVEQHKRLVLDPDGWQRVGRAIEIRNRITHPEDYSQCNIQEWELDDVDGAELWFQKVNNEFVRMAEGHRKVHGW